MKCEIWESVTRWEFVKEVKTLGYKYMFTSFAGATGTSYWRRSYIAEEERMKKRVKECDHSQKILSRTTESRMIQCTNIVKTNAIKVYTGRNIEYGDKAWTIHPWTGEKVDIRHN